MTEAIKWGEPRLFKTEGVRELTGDVFPAELKQFASEVSKSLEISESVIVFCMLGVISTALQGKYVVQFNEDYKEPLNLYLMFSLPPAECKSAALKFCMAPLVKYEQLETARLMENYKREKSLYEAKVRAIENSKKGLIIGSHKEKFEEICELESKLVEPKSLPQYFLTDVTSEALVLSLKEQNNRIAIISDEGGSLDVLGGLYNNGRSNIDILLKGWDGSPVRIKRMGASIALNPLLVFCLAVQPDYLDYVGQNKSFAGRGFFERFLYCVPKSRIGTKEFKNETVSKEVKKQYEEAIFHLLSLPYPKEPEGLVLSKGAEKLWIEFRREIELELSPVGKLNCCQRWGGKLGGQTLRLAGLLHLVWHKVGKSIDEKTMERAIQIAQILITHTIKVFETHLLKDFSEEKDVEKIFEAIKELHKTELKQADLTKYFRHTMKVEKIAKAIPFLVERNIISTPIEGANGKTIAYYVNPKIWRKSS